MIRMADQAPPILGSALLAAEGRKSRLEPRSLQSGCSSIDASALQGGFRYGEINSIAGASEMGKSLIALHTIASQLIDHEGCEVALIDTSGSFSPWRLRDVIAFRLGKISSYRQSGYMYEKIPNVVDLHTKLALEEKAVRMLERVKVMRTFDFAGVVEATSEVRDLWETLEREKEQNHEISKPIGEIPNSQDSDDEDLTTTDTKTELPPTITTSGGIRLIIIDNIANVTSSTMATSQTQGQALLISFLRSLRTLTITYHICTLMINAAVGLAPTTTITPHFNYYKRRQPEENNASIFSSTFGRPALGKAYAHLIDTSIFLSRIPRTKEDVQLAYGGSNSGGEGKKWDSVGVFEVLRDRYGTREGRWATFEMGARVKIR